MTIARMRTVELDRPPLLELGYCCGCGCGCGCGWGYGWGVLPLLMLTVSD